MKGLTGGVLEVDLTSGSIAKTTIPEDVWRRFLGGAGVAAYQFFCREDPGLDPLSPENPLYFITGPLAGTGVQGSSRFAVCAKSPLTQAWGEATCGGTFAVELKAAGFDAVILRGASPKPVVLVIEDGQASLRDAGHLWGLDSYETVDRLKDELGYEKRKFKIACIGQAGEKLVRFAAVCHDKHDYAGRTGMGAVMGSKRLKAVACRGSGDVEVHDPEGLKVWKRKVAAQVKESVPARGMREMGTNGTMDLSMMIGDVPLKNYEVGEALDLAASIGGPAMTERFLVKPTACMHCPIACRRVMKDNEPGPYQTAQGPGPEYETVGSFGALCMNADAASLLMINEWCNRYGMDTITGGCTVAFAIDCFEKGILTLALTQGLELRFGDPACILELVHRIGRREGVGDLLAEGSRIAAKRLGPAAQALTAEIKGLELPMHDPRGSHGMGLAYMMSNRGACHNAHLMHPVEQGMVAWEDVGFEANYEGKEDAGKGAAVRLAEDFGVQCNAIPLCNFNVWCYKGDDAFTALNLVTGWSFDLAEYLRTGARIWLLKRALINLMGITAADDRLPQKVKTPLQEGGAAGSVPDEDRLRRDYYAARGLDDRGWPRRETLLQVGLAEVAARLYPTAE